MCVAILTKPGAFVPKLGLANGFSSNRDGAGYAYVDPDAKKVVIKKGFMLYNDLEKSYYADVEKYAEHSPFLVHMRIRTSGHVSPANCHPFKIKGGAMIHNGSLFYPDKEHIGTPEDRKSDTRVFAEVLHNILTFEDVKAAEDAILGSVGRYNKLAFLYDDGRYHIMNERAGSWKDDVWYSNDSCRIYTNNRGTTPSTPSGAPNPNTV